MKIFNHEAHEVVCIIKNLNIVRDQAMVYPSYARKLPEYCAWRRRMEGSLPGTILKGRYLIEKELGRGGIGAVYLARDQQLLSKPVVIKVLLDRPADDDWIKNKFHQ